MVSALGAHTTSSPNQRVVNAIRRDALPERCGRLA